MWSLSYLSSGRQSGPTFYDTTSPIERIEQLLYKQLPYSSTTLEWFGAIRSQPAASGKGPTSSHQRNLIQEKLGPFHAISSGYGPSGCGQQHLIGEELGQPHAIGS
jgi:hypothetical protein